MFEALVVGYLFLVIVFSKQLLSFSICLIILMELLDGLENPFD